MAGAFEPFRGPRGTIPPDWTGRLQPQVPASPAAGDYNLNAPEVHRIRIPLDNAQVRAKYEITGNCLWVVQSSSPAANCVIHLNRDQSDGIPLSAGLALRTPPFSKVYIQNTAQAGAWIELIHFIADFEFSIVNPVSLVTTVTLAKATAGDHGNATMAAGVQQTIIAASATRRRAYVTNEGPYPVRMGYLAGAALTNTVGYWLDVGDTLEFFATDGITARSLSTSPGNTFLSWITESD